MEDEVVETAPEPEAATAGEQPKPAASALEAVERAHAAGEDKAGAADAEVQPKPADKKYHVPPPEKWEGILGNARTEAVREFREKYGWAENLTKEQVEYAMQIAGRLRTPAEARRLYEELGKELKELDPDDEEEAEPEPDLQSEDGKHKTYSDVRVRKLLALQEKRLLAKFRKEMQPTTEFTKAEQARRVEEDNAARAEAAAKEAVDSVMALPHAKENRKHLSAELAAMEPQLRIKLGPYGAMQYAYNKMLEKVVLPGYDKEADKRVRESFKRDANASAVNIRPGGKADIGKAKVKMGDVDGLARHIQHLHESAK